MIISIEIMLLAVTLLILISSFGFDDNVGQTFSIYIISIAGAESVIGLSILVSYYRLTNYWISSCLSRFINFNFKSINKHPGLFGKTKVKSNSINKFSSLISLFHPYGAYGRQSHPDGVASFARLWVTRYSLERNYCTTVNYSDSNNDSIKFNIRPPAPWFVTGLYDAESSFVVIILKNSRYKTG